MLSPYMSFTYKTVYIKSFGAGIAWLACLAPLFDVLGLVVAHPRSMVLSGYSGFLHHQTTAIFLQVGNVGWSSYDVVCVVVTGYTTLCYFRR